MQTPFQKASGMLSQQCLNRFIKHIETYTCHQTKLKRILKAENSLGWNLVLFFPPPYPCFLCVKSTNRSASRQNSH